MKKDDLECRNAQINEILGAFYKLRAQNAVKSQRDFARLVGVSEQTLSAALRGRDRYMTDSLYEKVKTALQDFSIEIKDISDLSGLSAGGDIIIEDKSQKNLPAQDENVPRLLDMLSDRDAQINRLLTLLENEQRARGICL